MSVYFKFNSELNYSYVDFDGLHISVSDLKKSILHQKRLGKSADFDLLISNAQTKEEYKDEQCLIPKNTSLIVARIPISNQNKKSWEIAQNSTERAPPNPAAENINHDISRMNGTEEDKIQAMMMQSTLDYDPTNYQRVRQSTQTGDVPANYRCHKCNKPGHWIKNCPLNPPGEKHHHFKNRPESKKMTGIPRSLRENLGTENPEPNQSQFIEEKREIPEDLICTICKGIFKDAVMIPCCGSSFCDECVRTALLESEDSECPDCKEKGTSPGSLIPNRFLRNAVTAFFAESSNVLSRDNQKKVEEETIVPEIEAAPIEEELAEDESLKDSGCLQTFDDENFSISEKDNDDTSQHNAPEKDSESDDDDNITVTVPPPHQQSRGATFRDSRLRRIPSHNMNEFSHSSSSKNHHEDGESHEEENSDSYNQRQQSGSKRSNYEHSSSSNPPQGISTLVGEEKSGAQGLYHSSSSSHSSNQNMSHGSDSQNVYQQQHQQHQPMYNQNQPPNVHSGMMPQMHSHSMFQQGPYHQTSGPYFPPNQIRPMRFDHQGNYPPPQRHHHVQQPMMRPSMHENFNMRHQRPPINHLANAVTQNIQQRYGTGIIDDPLEAFNRIMREKEMRKDRYRRSPKHGDRRSRSFERKRSPMGQYSPDSRRQKNYNVKARKRSRSFKSNSSKSYSRSRSRTRNRSTRGRSKSRSYSPRYRRKENVQNKDRRDERMHRSPARRGNHHNNRSSRGNYKQDQPSKHGLRDAQENFQYHENMGNQIEKAEQNFDYSKQQQQYEEQQQLHNLDEQPPPPGDESELQDLVVPKMISEGEVQEKGFKASSDDVKKESSDVNGSSKSETDARKIDQTKTDHHHHHHKKNRGKNYETSSDDKKVRDKKKRKKSREHDKKKSKKDRKVRSDKEKEKKSSSKAGSVEKTPEGEKESEHKTPEKVLRRVESKNEEENASLDKHPMNEPSAVEPLPVTSLKVPTEKQGLRRSDSVLDINPELDLDEWIQPEVSKWERDESKSLEIGEAEVGNGDVKRNPEEKVTSEILKRAENAIFARAISAIRPQESKRSSKPHEADAVAHRKDSPPVLPIIKRSDSSKDSKIQAFQVTVPTNESGTRSVELKSSESTRDSNKLRKSPMKPSIKNRLGVKIVEKRSRTKSLSRSPKRRLQSDCTKVVRPSRDAGARSQPVRSGGSSRGERHPSSDNRHPSSDNRRNYKQLNSLIKVTQDLRDNNTQNSSRGRQNDKRRSHTPEDKRGAPRRHRSRSRSASRHNVRRADQRSNTDRGYAKSKELPRNDEKPSKPADPSLSDSEKLKARSSRSEAEPSVKKRSRESSSSSTSSSASSNGSQKHSKRHGKHKVKKKSRSLSADSNGNSKRKKSKKEKKSKKKKKSSRK